jgi:hypothetical protein
VYENKQNDDNLPDKNTDISTQLHEIYKEDTRILQKSAVLLSLFERWGTNPSLQISAQRGDRDASSTTVCR